MPIIDDHTWSMIDAIPGWMGREECEWLAQLATKSRSWTEIGVYCGRSAMAVGLFLPTGSLLQLVDIVLDLNLITFEEKVGNWQDLNLGDCRRWLPRNLALLSALQIRVVQSSLLSTEAAKDLLDTDVVFIDATHEYIAVKADILAWKDKCKVLCGHDYQKNYRESVMRAVDELIEKVSQPAGDIWLRS